MRRRKASLAIAGFEKHPSIARYAPFCDPETSDGILTFLTEQSKESDIMSSLSRRACFKCGNVGHYAGKTAWRMV
jgi:hypothetical protein